MGKGLRTRSVRARKGFGFFNLEKTGRGKERLENASVQDSLWQFWFLSLGEEEVLQLAIGRLTQVRMKPWLEESKVLAEETRTHKGCGLSKVTD